MLKRLIIFSGILLVAFSAPSFAAVPRAINFQGKLIHLNGSPETTAQTLLTFKIWTSSAEYGTLVWTSSDMAVNPDFAGQFSVDLENGTPPLDNIDFNQPLWLEIALASDPTHPFTPRQRLTAVPYAFSAITVESVAGGGGGGLSTAEADTRYIMNTTEAQTASFNITGEGTIGGNLTVSGTGNSSFAGNVGIGTDGPTSKLTVAGTIDAQGGVKFPGGITQTVAYTGGGTLDRLKVVGSAEIGDASCAATGQNSVAMGWGTIASGEVSTAMGYHPIASGDTSTAMGWYTKASGYISTAMGSNTIASGQGSTTMGEFTVASSYDSVAMGAYTTASGTVSTAMGEATTASGFASTSMGRKTIAQPFASLAIGQFNVASGTPGSWIGTDPVFIIGNGADVDHRSNAMTVLKNGNVGIGTTAPTEALDVNGNAKIGANGLTISDWAGGSWINIPTSGPSGIGSGGAGISPWISYALSSGQWFTNSSAGDIAYRNTSGRLLFGNSGTLPSTMAITNGKVGIGTNDPTDRLDVDGNIRMRGTGTTLPAANASNRGTMYLLQGTPDKLYMCMMTSTSSYQWVMIARGD